MRRRLCLNDLKVEHNINALSNGYFHYLVILLIMFPVNRLVYKCQKIVNGDLHSL